MKRLGMLLRLVKRRTVNVPIDVARFLQALAPHGKLHVVGAILQPMEVLMFDLLSGQKSISSSPTGTPTAIDELLNFSARHAIAPLVEVFPMSEVNDAFEHLRSGKARYRIVLESDF